MNRASGELKKHPVSEFNSTALVKNDHESVAAATQRNLLVPDVYKASCSFDDVMYCLKEPETKISNTGRALSVKFIGSVNTKEV